MIRIGIDVGGTNTDAVVLDGGKVLAGVKSPTTSDVMSGVVNALRAVLDESGMAADKIDVVMVGTTHFTNAVVQRRDLAETAAVRLGLPATASLPPMVDWPDDLKKALAGTPISPMAATSSTDGSSRRSTKRNFWRSPPTSRPRASTPSPFPRCSRRSMVISKSRRARSSPRPCRVSTSPCRAISAASACSNAKTRRS